MLWMLTVGAGHVTCAPCFRDQYSTGLPLPRHSLCCSCQTAKEAAGALMHAARRNWAATCSGVWVDDITVAVAMLP